MANSVVANAATPKGDGAAVKPHIRLRGVNGSFKGRFWESSGPLRIGRQSSLEVVLEDASVSRRHAELRVTEAGWGAADLGSTNGTWLNGVRIEQGARPLQPRDMLRIGDVLLVVDALQAGRPAEGAEPPRAEGATRASWEEALRGVAPDGRRCPRPGEHILAMLRAGRHLVHLGSEEQLLHSILEDAVAALDAQRGAVVLAGDSDGELRVRALASGSGRPGSPAAGQAGPAGRQCFSQSLARRSLDLGESILCQHVDADRELALAPSIAEGSMASVLCVLLRTPRKRLGVLHLDRGPWQKPFTMDDLHLADALAANVSAGIESVQLLRKQRDLFLNTIGVLAQVVELRDKYTGGHTARVTVYSVLLAQEMKASAPDLDLIRMGGPLHDIGKIGVDDAILRKEDRLSAEEFEAMKLHTVRGAEIVAGVPELRPVLPIVRSHHERWDGQGYPDGLRGEDIPFPARVVAVADTFDAMTSDRPYRLGLPPATAFAELETQAGRQFDPACVASFLAIRSRIVAEMRNGHAAATAVITRELKACLAG